jgi:serine protease Do
MFLARLIVTCCGLLAIGAPGPRPSAAPNTVGRALQRSGGAVVKLYGGRIGREHGYGTGFLVSPDGGIVTSLSLLVAGRNIRAVLDDGRELDARVVRTDEYRQLALLKVDAKDLPHLELMSSETIRIGDTVIALGNWFKIAEGREPVSVIRGILSLRTNLDARRLSQGFDYRGPVLIYDAITSNPGSSGGPLLDVEGRCIGMVGRIVESANTNTRLNYALPSEEIMAFLSEEATANIDERAGPTSASSEQEQGGAQPYVGIKISRLGYHNVSAYVQRVRPGSPAAEAGIQADDLIISINGRRIHDAADYKDLLESLSPGQSARFVLKRGPKVITLDVQIGAQ